MDKIKLMVISVNFFKRSLGSHWVAVFGSQWSSHKQDWSTLSYEKFSAIRLKILLPIKPKIAILGLENARQPPHSQGTPFELLLQSKLGVFGSQEIPSHFEFQNSFLLDFPLQMGWFIRFLPLISLVLIALGENPCLLHWASRRAWYWTWC